MGTHKGLTIPDYTDPADVPKAFIELIDSGIIPPFPNAAAADTAGLGEGAVAVIGGQLQIKSGGNWGAVATPYTLPSATSSVQGGVRLNDATNSGSGNGWAATPSAVKAVMDQLNAFKNSFQMGKTTLRFPGGGAGTSDNKKITFPRAFARIPEVFVQSSGEGEHAWRRTLTIGVIHKAKTEFTMVANSTNTTGTAAYDAPVDWFAVAVG